jgi:MerR family transcriptional regulator, mercuric resistance operon regulatory protein
MAGNEIGIGEASRRTGCNIETIRYYERIGLVPKPGRTASRYRVFAREDIQRLIFIRRASELGFTLDEIRDLLRLAAAVPDACAAVRDVAAGHLDDVRAKIADLEKMERMLAKAVRQCERGERQGCPVIDALSSDAIAWSSGSRRLRGDRTSGRPRSQRRRRRAGQR